MDIAALSVGGLAATIDFARRVIGSGRVRS
jgi:hypothetical protein